MRKRLLFLLLFFLLPAPLAHGEGISVKDPWVRQNPPGTSVTAAYMVIENPGADDELLGISCACAREASIHVIEMKEDSDSMVMREVPSIAVPSGASLALSPGGTHVMLMGLSGDMDKSVVLELEFRSGARISVTAPVLSPKAARKHDHH
ncbi:MAG: copper chaperone PCu(A)C [Candidatus Dadabacteria bacterium]|nr:copper chaperone PCu(A)C [Candidatus Dadabacteria bacterium]MYA48792.1 copper chaperone PCu(A)C [Candidatus Dadabacteria bacterium]MYF48427.1 copper chaperone PCu(A)C [Candidatus Dadabacteria bacterium]MYG82785.1 copper chaperone PCu(A)C [Candidatus Dadabacteria bacterium]MYK49332.1 copper chaperone PCu(A)C [Candidatus Dadabacteria bacterium]